MSEYTPTTKEIEELATDYLLDESITSAAFYRWLNEVKAEAWEVGYQSALRNITFADRDVLDVNPYRQGEEQ